AGLGMHHLELHRVGQLHADGLALVELNVQGHVFLHVLGRVAQLIRPERVLLVRLRIHEDVFFTGRVQVLHLAGFNVRPLHALAGPERALHHVAGAHVFQGGSHERRALARLDVQELDDDVYAVLQADGHAFAQVVDRYHAQTSLWRLRPTTANRADPSWIS